MRILVQTAALAALVGLSACGDNFQERALIGAGAGAVTAVAVEGDVATGALVGAAGNVAFCELYPNRC